MSGEELAAVVRRKFEDPLEIDAYAYVSDDRLTRFEAVLIAQAFKPGDLVLDVGCGGGREAIPMVRGGLRVVAMDLVRAMVSSTVQRANEQGVKLWPVVGSASHPPFRDGVFGGIAMLGQVISHVPGRDTRIQTLRRLRRTLSSGATLAMTTHNRRCGMRFLLYFAVMNRWRAFWRQLGCSSTLGDYDRWSRRASRSRSKRPVFFHMYDREEAMADLRQAGFQDIEGKARSEFERERDDPSSRDRDYLLGFLARDAQPKSPRGG